MFDSALEQLVRDVDGAGARGAVRAGGGAMTVAPRFECKYCVPASEADGVLRVARVFLDIDRAAWPDAVDGGPLPVQRITSLYLDSPAQTFLAWHLARRPTRFKLRLRRYSVGQRGIAWAEVKHKVDGRVLKTRSPLPLEAVPSVESGRSAAGQDRPASTRRWTISSRASAPSTRARRCCFSANAVACVAPAASARGRDGRYGSQLSARPRPVTARRGGRGLAVAGRARGGARPAAIVELKHGGRPPVWMRRLMTRLEPWRCSYSKYVAAMQAAAIQEGGR